MMKRRFVIVEYNNPVIRSDGTQSEWEMGWQDGLKWTIAQPGIKENTLRHEIIQYQQVKPEDRYRLGFLAALRWVLGK